ncbi:MAG: hypothetical protein GQE15_04820 [Archangiaceae bacterium]|nr:hypothetical protein [Archangiaceae bacterium]
MTFPMQTAASWRSASFAERTAAVEAAITAIEAALVDGATLAKTYDEVSFLIERELAGELRTGLRPITAELVARWTSSLRRVHLARYGFEPARVTRPQLESALPDIKPERLHALAALAGDVADAADGATLAQVASLLVKNAKTKGLKVSSREALRIVAALEGAAIPAK